MVDFCHKYHISLGHSTTYYPQGNGLVESSNKILVNIIKKILEDNKNSWHKKLINALWDDGLTTKKSIGMSPYQLVYGMDVVFPSSMGVQVMKIIQEVQSDPNDIQRRIYHTIQLQQSREEVYNRTQVVQENIKKIFDKRTKADDFNLGDKVLKWDLGREEKGKHGKFDPLWLGTFKVVDTERNNTFMLEKLEGEMLKLHVNGKFLKIYF